MRSQISCHSPDAMGRATWIRSMSRRKSRACNRLPNESGTRFPFSSSALTAACKAQTVS